MTLSAVMTQGRAGGMPRKVQFLTVMTLGLLQAALVYGEDAKPDHEQLGRLLRREIVAPDVPQREVEDFCEARVPAMAAPLTAEAWLQEADKRRRAVLRNVVFRGEAAKWRDADTKVEWLEVVEGGPGYRIRKLRFEALPGLWIPALLYEPENLTGRVPAVLNVNGHDGAGKAAPYKQIRCINLAKRGMLAMNVEWLGMGQLRSGGYMHYRMNQLDLCGTSGLAPFFLNMQRALDVLLSHENADPERVAVAGLSGGGWQTIIISSLDERVKLANPVAGYSSFRTRARFRSDLGDSEQTPVDLAVHADYAHLTAMMAPRGLLLTYNEKDNCCFASGHALPPLLEAAEPIYKLLKSETRLRSHINSDPGNHNFERDNREALYRMLGDQFYSGSEGYNPREIDSAAEVKTSEYLNVELPAENLDFHKLAMQLAAELPRNGKTPSEPGQAESWQQERREALRAVVRAADYEVRGQQIAADSADGADARYLRLRVGDAWTVPAVVITQGEAQQTVLLVCEAGRSDASAVAAAERWLAAGHRVVSVDPFYWGESKIKSHDFLYGLLISAVGERPLGVQASQLAAIARWLRQEHGQPVTIAAVGPKSSLAALVAANLEPRAIDRVQLEGSLGSLHEVLEQDQSVNINPEYFCFGLLEQFDISTLAAMIAPREVQLKQPSERAKQELAGLARWYRVQGKDFDPLASE